MKAILFNLFIVVHAVAVGCLWAAEPDGPKSAQPEFVTEVMAIKQIKAADIADAMNRLVSGNRQGLIEATLISGNLAFPDQIKALADPRANLLAVSADRSDMEKIRKIIAQLDKPITHILIEGLLFEFLPSNSGDLSARHTRKDSKNANEGFYESGLITNLVWITNGSQQATGPLPSSHWSPFHYVASPRSDFASFRNELVTDDRVNLIQHPKIQTTSGTTTRIPLRTERVDSGPSDSTFLPSTSPPARNEQETSSLEITPTIDANGAITLEVRQSIHLNPAATNRPAVLATADPLTVNVVTLKLADRDSILIGGMTKKSKQQRTLGVPVLKNIPVLGSPFRRSSTRISQSEIALVLRAAIIPASASAPPLPAK